MTFTVPPNKNHWNTSGLRLPSQCPIAEWVSKNSFCWMSSAVPWYCSSLWRLGQIAYRPFMRRLITCNSTSLVWNSHICLRSRNDHTMAQLTSAMALVCVKIDVATLWQSIVTSSSVSFSKIARWWSRGDKRTMSSARKLNTSTDKNLARPLIVLPISRISIPRMPGRRWSLRNKGFS